MLHVRDLWSEFGREEGEVASDLIGWQSGVTGVRACVRVTTIDPLTHAPADLERMLTQAVSTTAAWLIDRQTHFEKFRDVAFFGTYSLLLRTSVFNLVKVGIRQYPQMKMTCSSVLLCTPRASSFSWLEDPID